jgi:heat shock protein HslJ
MKKLIIGLLVLFLLAACAGGSSASITGQWKLVSYGPAGSQIPALSNVNTNIEFTADGKLNGNVGCNSFGGDYKVNGKNLTFGPIMSTMMACGGQVDEQEMAAIAVFQKSAAFVLDGNSLTITSADGKSVIVLARR